MTRPRIRRSGGHWSLYHAHLLWVLSRRSVRCHTHPAISAENRLHIYYDVDIQFSLHSSSTATNAQCANSTLQGQEQLKHCTSTQVHPSFRISTTLCALKIWGHLCLVNGRSLIERCPRTSWRHGITCGRNDHALTHQAAVWLPTKFNSPHM